MHNLEHLHALPHSIVQVRNEILPLIRAHPQHEFGQNRRRTIYNVLRETPQGEQAAKWLALLSAQRVLSIYEQTIAQLEQYDEETRTFPRQVLQAVEGILKQTSSDDSPRWLVNELYHFLHIGLDLRVPYLALKATYEAACEVLGGIPLRSQVSLRKIDPNGAIEWRSSTTLSDEELAGIGCSADDAAVNAAYAWAEVPNRKYDYAKVLEFWEWWLLEALPQAWENAASIHE